MYTYKVKAIDRVVDGDTVDVTVDLGFDIHHHLRIRLYGIDTPEVRTKDLEEKARGFDAKDRVATLLASCFDENHYLELKTAEKGKYGRYLGIFTRVATKTSEDEDVRLNINELLVEEGHAVNYYGGTR